MRFVKLNKKILRVLGNILLLFISIGCSLLILEFATLNIKKDYEKYEALKYPPWGTPSAKGTWASRGDYINTVINNSEGFHDFQRDIKKHTRIRIAFLGDSFVEAWQVPREKMHYNIVSSMLNKKFGNDFSESMGFGRSGASILEYTNYYHQLATKYNNDIIVVMLYIMNDFENNFYEYSLKRGYLPQFARNKYGDIVSFSEAYPDIFNKFHKNKPIKNNNTYSSIGNIIKTHMPGTFFMLNEASKNNYKLYSILNKLGILANKKKREEISSHSLILLKDPPSFVNNAIEFTLKNIALLKDQVIKDGKEFLLVLVPGDYIDKNNFNMMLENYPKTKHLNFDPDNRHRILAERLKNLNIEFIDLLSIFRDRYKKDGDYPFFNHDKHLSEAGHRIAAEVVASFLENKISE